MTVLIVPDKFKGTLTAHEAARAIARGWHKARPRDTLKLLPMSDGGDGFGQIISESLQAERRMVSTVDAAHRPCKTTWWWDEKSGTAIIESANVIGLAMLQARKFHPFDLDTFGLAAVMQAARNAQPKRILVGIGGSATNDAGFGMARALGWEFRDAQGSAIEQWTALDGLKTVQPPTARAASGKTIVAVDVQNPLLGPRGATRVYGPQKGLRPQDFAHAERCLRRLANVMKRQFGKDVATLPGAGAAGGLGFGLAAFLGAELHPGFELFSKYARLSRWLHTADLAITGEGAVDRSTVMGKGVGQIARQCAALKIPCIALAGTIDRSLKLSQVFTEAHALTEITSVKAAKARAAHWLTNLAEGIASNFDERGIRETRPHSQESDDNSSSA